MSEEEIDSKAVRIDVVEKAEDVKDLTKREILCEIIKLVLWVIYASVVISIFVSIFFWIWSYLLYEASDSIAILHKESLNGDCYRFSMAAFLSFEHQHLFDSLIFWGEGTVRTVFFAVSAFLGSFLVYDMPTNWAVLGDTAFLVRRKLILICVIFCILSYGISLIAKKVTFLFGMELGMPVIGTLILSLYWTRFTKALPFAVTFWALFFLQGATGFFSLYVLLKSFLHASSVSKALRRVFFSGLKAFAIGPGLFLLRRVCDFNAQQKRDTLLEGNLSGPVASFSAVMSFYGRILQTGGGTFEIVLVLEIVAAMMEILELRDFVKGRTFMNKLWKRVKGKELMDTSPNEGFKKVLSSLLIISMISEAAGSLIAAAYLLLLKVTFDPSATSFDTQRVVVNSCIGYFGEIVLSDIPVLIFVIRAENNSKNIVTLASLKDAKKNFHWGMAVVLGCIFCFALEQGGTLLVNDMCPAFDGESYFLKPCEICVS